MLLKKIYFQILARNNYFSRRPVQRGTSNRFKLQTTTPAAVTNSRTTNTSRRRFYSTAPSTAKSQDTSRSRNYSRFNSRQTRVTTTLRSLDQTVKGDFRTDQTLEPSNQEPHEKELQDDTTQLADLATVLNELQKNTVRISNFSKSYSPPRKNELLAPEPNRKLISTTFTPIYFTTTTNVPPPIYPTAFFVRQQQPRPFEKVVRKLPQARHVFEAITGTYDYYDDDHTRVVSELPQHSKVLLHASGIIQCLDQGNFPHPASCKKFIYCAKIDSGDIIGWEYTCPKDLSFDPIGGICNWSAGLGCNQ